MNALTQNFADTIERECRVLEFTASDHEAGLDRLTDLHRKRAAETEQRIARTKKDLRTAVTSYKAEIAEIERKIDEAKAGAARKVEVDQKILAACRGFLSAAE
jgi:anti-sigma-K factor RskA